mmetsp:Transcript_29144/g.36155  ORF Transcript_29144/g.36155 Transcript_29144/m.36155 type:complete len:175 (+) Transcript_29144:35-559(+)
MTSFLSSLFKRGAQTGKTSSANQVALITNFSACPLGVQLLDRLAESNARVVAVAHDAQRFEGKYDEDKVSLFDAFANEEEDRARLISFLMSKQMQVATLVQNQPFMLKPTVDEPLSKKEDPARLQMLQEKVRILVEAPLYFAGDLFDSDLIASEARMLSILHRQHGMYHLLRAS